MTVIAAPRLLVDDRLTGPGWVRLDGARIAEVSEGVPAGQVDLALGHGLLAPGLIDLQLNGAFGHDFADVGAAGWDEVRRRLPATGVTAFVPTLITAPIAEMIDGLRRYAALADLERSGCARTLGIHLEGPFLAERRRGAHRAELLLDADTATVDRLVEAAAGHLRYVTLAPERPGGLAAVERFVAAGVSVAIGHSDATDEQVIAAADVGASMVTHLFNAQRPLHHRDPGVVGAALVDDRLFLGLIVDGHHVAPTAVRTAFAAARERLFLVTDAISALGMAPGDYLLGGEPTLVREGRPPLREDGTIAGSVVTMDEAVRRTVGLGVDLATALTAATRRPADVMGRPDLGRLEPGAQADLVWMDDQLRPRRTWVGGEAAVCASPVAVG